MKPRLASAIFRSPLGGWSPTELLAYFRQRRSVHYFPVLDESQTHRAKADEILRNRFNFNEEAYELNAGFDWTKNPSADIEWLILLHKFYYAAELGLAYDETRDERYAAKWMELTDGWIATVPMDFLPSDVAGRRIQNWISAHYYFVTLNAVPTLSPLFYTRFLNSLHEQVRHLIASLTPARNHRTLELWAIFFVAVVFPEFREADRWLEFAKQELLANAQDDILPDGVHCELSTDYHHLVLRNFLYVARLAKLNNIELPARLHAKILQALKFSLHSHKPDGTIPSLSDGDTGSFLALLKQGYELYGDKTMLYVASKGRAGQMPVCRSRAFKDGGYFTQRSGWGEIEAFADERYLIFDCGALGAGNHGHLDLLSFEMAAYGQSLVVDPGRFTYHEPAPDSGEINWRVFFRGTAAHNTVVVDGKNQTRYEFHKRKFKIKGEAPDHELKAFVTRSGFDYLHGVARSHQYNVTHERRIVFVAGEYWVISDVLLSDDQHEYDLLFHLSHKAMGRTSVESQAETLRIDAPHLVIAQSHDPNIESSLESGFVSPTYGVKHAAPVVRFTQRAANTSFHTILFPYQAERPELTIQPLEVFSEERLCSPTETTAFCVTIQRGERVVKDHFLFVHQRQHELHQCGNLRFQGALNYFRKTLSGELVSQQTV
jgi:uncharacterized heparinase superfamily protein